MASFFCLAQLSFSLMDNIIKEDLNMFAKQKFNAKLNSLIHKCGFWIACASWFQKWGAFCTTKACESQTAYIQLIKNASIDVCDPDLKETINNL